MQVSNEWFVADAELNGNPLMVRGRLFLDAIRESGRFSTRVALVWEYTGDEKGMPRDKEVQVLDFLNDKIRVYLESNEWAVLTAIYIGDQEARYEYYGVTAEQVSQGINEVLSQYPPMPIKIGAKSEPEWGSYIAMIEQFAIQS